MGGGCLTSDDDIYVSGAYDKNGIFVCEYSAIKLNWPPLMNEKKKKKNGSPR